jgi:hypothetical protein
MQRLASIALLAALVSGGCVHSPHSARPFTEEWVRDQDRVAAFERRKARLKGDEIVLVGNKEGARAAVQMDDKGRPRLNVGKRRGLSADLDLDPEEAEVEVKYKWGWKGKPPRRRRSGP